MHVRCGNFAEAYYRDYYVASNKAKAGYSIHSKKIIILAVRFNTRENLFSQCVSQAP